MKIEALVFIRDKEDLKTSLNEIENVHKVIFVCLTFEAFLEAKKKNLKYTYAYKLKNINKINYIKVGRKSAKKFLKNLNIDIIDEDNHYLTSRFVIFFSQLCFDKSLIFNSIKHYKPSKIYLFREIKDSVIEKGWSQNRSYYYYNTIIKYFFPKLKLKYYGLFDYKLGKFSNNKLKKINFNFILINLKNFFKIFYYKNIILIEGFKNNKNLKKKFIKNFKNKKYTIIDDFKNSLIIRLKYFFFKTEKPNKYFKTSYKKLKIYGLDYKNLKIEVDAMLKFISNYLSFQKFLISVFKKKNYIFGIFQEKYETIIALKKAKIKTYQLPHGATITPELSPMIANYNFFPNLIQKKYHEESYMIKGKSFLTGVPHINLIKSENKKNFKNIIIFMKNMGMRRWEYDDYQKILDIVNSVINYSKKNKHNVIIKFHPSGGKYTYSCIKNYKLFLNNNLTITIDTDTDELLKNNNIFICLQESSIINQIITMKKNVIFPLMHLNRNYKKNYLFENIKRNLIIPEKIGDIASKIDLVKKKNIKNLKKNKKLITDFGEKSMDNINRLIYSLNL